MDDNNTAKKIKQISQVNKSFLMQALSSAKKTRKKVRKKIDTGNLDKVPVFISTALRG